MLKLTCTITDERWPLVTINVVRESFKTGVAAERDQIQYDLAYDKAEVMLHNQLRPLVAEIIERRKHGLTQR